MAAQVIPSTQVVPASPHTFWGETGGFWCQTLVLLLAAIIAAIAIRRSRILERKKAAAGVIFTTRRDEQLTKALRVISQLHNDEKNMATYAKDEHKDSEQAKAIRYALNHYEYVSVGIAEDMYDEEIFKKSSYTTMTNLYNRTRPYIAAVRKNGGSKTTWQEFECLACRWLDDPLEHKSVRSVPDERRLRKWLAKKIAGKS